MSNVHDSEPTLAQAQHASQRVLAQLKTRFLDDHRGQPKPDDGRALIRLAHDNDARPPGDWEIMIPYRLNDGSLDEGLRVHVAPVELFTFRGAPAGSYVLGIELLDYDDVLSQNRKDKFHTVGNKYRGLSLYLSPGYKSERVGTALLFCNATLYASAPPIGEATLVFRADVKGDRITLFMEPVDAVANLEGFIEHLVAVSRPLALGLDGPARR
jgi:hypothetical protein